MFLRRLLVTNSSTTSHVYFGIMLEREELERLAIALGATEGFDDMEDYELADHVSDLFPKDSRLKVVEATGNTSPECFIVCTAEDWGEYKTLEAEVLDTDFADLQLIARQAGSSAKPSVLGYTNY
jgi:hypothetical protein